MNATVDHDKVARLTADVLAELRAGGADLGMDTAGQPSPRGTPASEELRTGGETGSETGAAASEEEASVWTASAHAETLRPEDLGLSPAGRPTLTCNISNRHIHVTQEALEKLFGPGAELKVRNELMQPGQFASEQTVSLIAGRGRAIETVRILGPCRKFTQVEISRTDGFYLGIRPPVRLSGDIKGSAGGTLVGPYGTLVLEEGIIVADRHIHTPPELAEKFSLKDNQFVRVRIFHSDKPALLERVRIRVNREFVLEMHLDNDDANACGIESGDRLELVL